MTHLQKTIRSLLFADERVVLQITKTYGFLTPDLWREGPMSKTPYDEFSAHLLLQAKKAAY